jgi:hypothetical protein
VRVCDKCLEARIWACPLFGIGQYHLEQKGYWWVIHDKKDKSKELKVNHNVLSIIQGNGAEGVHG